MSKRKQFKEFCPDAYNRILEKATASQATGDTLIFMRKSCITVELEDPLNQEETICAQINYGSDTEAQLSSCISHFEGMLRTIYLPHFLTFKPVILTELSPVIESVEFNDVAVFITYREGQKVIPLEPNQKIDCFAYNRVNFDRFVEHIGEIMLALKDKQAPTPVEKNTCHDHGHCQHCGNHSCEHAPSLIEGIWQGMSEAERNSFLSSLNPDQLETVLQQVNQRAEAASTSKDS